MRLVLVCLFTIYCACLSCTTWAKNTDLPDIGSSAQRLLTPAQQTQYGALLLAELRNQHQVIEDPQLGDWLQDIGDTLQSHSNQPNQKFTLFLLNQPEINAFATLGGYIAVNSGLLLFAQNEDQLAAVLSHEMAHVTQHHLLRSVERAQRDQIPILLGALAVIAAAQQSHGASGSNASMASISAALGMIAQRSINFTRENESEADRLGIRTLARSGYDPTAMATFFERLQTAMGTKDDTDGIPAYLRSHPLTSTRISEAKARAAQMQAQTQASVGMMEANEQDQHAMPFAQGMDNPMLPAQFKMNISFLQSRHAMPSYFPWAQERLRVLTANTPETAIAYYSARNRTVHGQLSSAEKYGNALAHVYAHKDLPQTITLLTSLSTVYPSNNWVSIALAQALDANGNHVQADSYMHKVLEQNPDQDILRLVYGQMLNARGTTSSGRQAVDILRPTLVSHESDPVFQDTFAHACALAGDNMNAGIAFAIVAYLRGYPERALSQLKALRTQTTDYSTRSRIQAYIETITPVVLDMQRQGARDPDA